MPSTATPVVIVQPTATVALSEQDITTLSSLEKVDDSPLYTMHYYGSTEPARSSLVVLQESANTRQSVTWACSLFAALGGTEKFYGRNFDWVDSPALLLFTHPADGYASVSMVDLAYLEFGDQVDRLTELPLVQRQALLDAPALPFDGMNERGLVVGMAAVPDGNMPIDPDKETIDSLLVIRKMLDQASTVDEAVAVLQRYNIDWGSGPRCIISSRIDRDSLRWSSSIRAKFKSSLLTSPGIWRPISWSVRSAIMLPGTACATTRSISGFRLRRPSDPAKAMQLLSDVSQPTTQWSMVYGLSTGEIVVTLGREYSPRILSRSISRIEALSVQRTA